MRVINYPSQKFISAGKKVVNKDENFEIVISANKKKIFCDAVPFLFSRDEKVESVFKVMQVFLRMFKFLVVHFYARGAGYRTSYYEHKSKLVVRYLVSEPWIGKVSDD